MENGVTLRFIRIVATVIAMTLIGCSEREGQEKIADGAGGRVEMLAQHGIVERDLLRVRRDVRRDRIWVLGLNYVHIYESAMRRLVRKIALPDLIVSRYDCLPDMVVDDTGSVWVSSNVQSRLWRIDGGDFRVTQHEIRLQGREGLDVGFGALAFNSDGNLLALTATAGGLLWKIDLRERVGRHIDLAPPLSGRCEFSELLATIAARH